MSWATTRDVIKTAIGAVSGITGGAGKVVDHKALLERPDTWRTAVKGTARLNYWTITREAATLRETGTGRRFVPGHEVHIEGWMAAAADGVTTEDLFQALVDAVLAALTSTSIHVRGNESEPLTLRAVPINLQPIGGVTCHHTEIRFPVQDAATVS